MMACLVKAEAMQRQPAPLSFISHISHYFLSVAHPHNASTNMCCLLSGCRGVKRLWGVFFILYRGRGGLFIIPVSLHALCLSPCNSHSLSFPLCLAIWQRAAGSCGVGGGALIQFILLPRDRQRERARAIGSGMETTDVREHFLLAAKRRDRPYRKLAWRCDAWIDPAGGCVCLGVCGRGHYQPKTMSLSKDCSGRRNQRQASVPFSIMHPTICWDGTWLTAQTESSQMIPAGEEAVLTLEMSIREFLLRGIWCNLSFMFMGIK